MAALCRIFRYWVASVVFRLENCQVFITPLTDYIGCQAGGKVHSLHECRVLRKGCGKMEPDN